MARSGWRNGLEMAAAALPYALFRSLGLERASRLGGRLGRFVGPRLGVSRRAFRNLERALPELGAAAHARIVADMWANLGSTLAEYPHLPTIAAEPDRIEVNGIERVRALIAEGRPCIFLSGHFANWEMLIAPMPRLGIQGGLIYRHANNPLADQFINGLRNRAFGMTLLPKGPKGAKEIVRLLKQKKSVAMLVDQKMNDGIEARLFGLPAMTTAAPAGLALRYGALLIPVSIERLPGPRFRITVYDEIAVDRSADMFGEIARLTQVINDFLESQIRARPHEWLWLHNRWRDD